MIQHIEVSPVRAGDFPETGTAGEKLRFLVRYAILAPSSHNTQPWRFRIQQDEIRLFADPARWLRIADRDQRELHISLGCALENLLIAAHRFRYTTKLAYFPDPAEPACVASIRLVRETTAPPLPETFEEIPRRHTNHKPYARCAVPEIVQKRLLDSCTESGILLFLTDDVEIRRRVDALVCRADARQFADAAYRDELAYWIGQGVFGTSWPLSKLGQLAYEHLNLGRSTAKKDSELLMSAPLLGLICSATDDRTSQLKAGQVFEDVCLTAASFGLRVQPMSQLCEVPETKAELAKLVPQAGLFPQHPFRLGYAEAEKEHTPRRPLEEVVEEQSQFH